MTAEILLSDVLFHDLDIFVLSATISIVFNLSSLGEQNVYLPLQPVCFSLYLYFDFASCDAILPNKMLKISRAHLRGCLAAAV